MKDELIRPELSLDERIAALSRMRAADPKPAEAVALDRAIEILGGTPMGPGQHPAGWTQAEWDARVPLPASKGLIVRCSLCGESAEDPLEGVDWLNDHDCPAVRPCSHCNRSGKPQCPRCKGQEHCCICKSKGQVLRSAALPANDLLTKLAKRTNEELLTEAMCLSRFEPKDHRELDKWLVTRELIARGFMEDSEEPQTAGDRPGSIPCVYCGAIQESRLTYARHLDACAKKPEQGWGPFLTMTVGACLNCKGPGFGLDDECAGCQSRRRCCVCDGTGRIGDAVAASTPGGATVEEVDDEEEETIVCPDCDGSGRPGGVYRGWQVYCPACDGTGRIRIPF